MEYTLRLRKRRESHRCRLAGNTVWSHMACDFPWRWGAFTNCYIHTIRPIFTLINTFVVSSMNCDTVQVNPGGLSRTVSTRRWCWPVLSHTSQLYRTRQPTHSRLHNRWQLVDRSRKRGRKIRQQNSSYFSSTGQRTPLYALYHTYMHTMIHMNVPLKHSKNNAQILNVQKINVFKKVSQLQTH